MEWFKELKISSKLYLLVAIASVFILLTSIIGYSVNANTSNALKIIYTENLVAISDLGDMRGNLNRTLADVLNTFQNTTSAEINALIQDIENVKADTAKKMEEFESTNPSEQVKREMERFQQIRQTFWQKMNPAISYAKENKNAEAYAIYKSCFGLVDDYRQSLLTIQKIQKEEAQKMYDDSIKATQTATVFLILVGGSALILMITLGLIIANAITRPIQHAIGELTTGSSEVSAASSQVEAASQQLAEGTQEQAASIQETSSTLEETASMVQQNNDNTKQAAIMAKNAKDYASKSNNEMNTMMQSMDDLKQSSNEIAKIIKVIDEIAFQTNLLSLNAAVEAARAGDAGKGFAVVAEEVRNLAQRSAIAAKDTSAIIEKNITLSENSAVIAKNVNDALGEIDTEARKVSELLEEISTATDEQSRGIGEINKAIQQMEQVMQSNSATADESAAASRELASQAANVNEIVRSLIRLVDGANAASSSSRLLASRPSAFSKNNGPKKSHLTAISSRINTESVIPLNDDF